jgi:predicted nucleotidyltransferase
MVLAEWWNPNSAIDLPGQRVTGFPRLRATPDSDVDLLVRFLRTRSFLQIVRIERELGAIIGRRVDLLTEAAISSYLRDRVLRDLRVLRGARRFGLSAPHHRSD